MKSLARLQFRQMFRGKKGRDLVGPAILILYFWIIELIVFIEVREKLPPLAGVLIFMAFFIPDFILKIIMERDHSVMDAFLKTRPVSQSLWERFLTVSQFWYPANLALPVAIAPACFMFLAFPLNIVMFIVVYLGSVFGGFLVMLLKHRGTYQSEKSASTKAARTFKSTTGHAIFGLQSKSVLRSKRLRGAIIYLTVWMFIMFLSYAVQDRLAELWLFYFICLGSSVLAQYGLGVEAGYFSAIWTRPVSISRVLKDKFMLAAALSGGAALISIPVCIWTGIPVYLPLAYALFSTGIGCPIALVDAYNCTPLDLFGKTFFNYQGSKGTFKVSTVLGMTVVLGLAILLPLLLSDLLAAIILGGLGLIGFAFHRPFFDWVERRFLANKHKYMEKYLSK